MENSTRTCLYGCPHFASEIAADGLHQHDRFVSQTGAGHDLRKLLIKTEKSIGTQTGVFFAQVSQCSGDG